MIQAWTQEKVSFHGKFFTIDGIPVIPKPYQKPHPPLMLVCVSPETIQMAARRKWSMLNSILFGPFSQITQNRDLYVATMRESGHSGTEIRKALQSWGVSRHIYVAPTDGQALREAEAAERWYQQSLARFLVPENIDTAPSALQPQFRAIAERLKAVTWEKLVEETVLFGSPERIVDRVHEMHEAGVGELLCWMNFGGLPHELVTRSMRLFAREGHSTFSLMWFFRRSCDCRICQSRLCEVRDHHLEHLVWMEITLCRRMDLFAGDVTNERRIAVWIIKSKVVKLQHWQERGDVAVRDEAERETVNG